MLTPKSTIEGLIWPALPGTSGRRILALLYQFEHSQWWDPEVLLRHQFRQLTTLVRHAHDTVPFYRQRLEAAGIDRKGALTPELWRRIPVLGRREVQGSFDALQSRRLPKAHGRTGQVFTSGATATPVKVVSSELSMLFWLSFQLREILWHQRDLGAKRAVIRPLEDAAAAYPEGSRSATWGPAVAGAYPSGPSVALDITTKVHQQAEWLRRQDPEYLVTYPSNLRALVAHCRERDIRLPRLRQVQTMSELLYPEVREACREVWGVEVADVYSTAEVGYIAVQCPETEHLHVQGEGLLVEVLGERDRPCRPGEVGQVVVTPLHNFAMPLLRYAVGDLAEVGERCACGRGLAVLARVLGRLRAMVRLPDGSQHYANFQDLLKGFDQINQFQVVRRGEQELEMKLVAARELDSADEGELIRRLRERFHYPFRVAFSYHEEIPRSPGGKFEDFRSEID